MLLSSIRQINIILILIILFSSHQVSAQTYNDGPIELQIRVSAVRVDYDTFSNLSNDFYLTSSMTSIIGNVMPVPGLQVDEITCKVWARDNMGSNWQGGSCILADLVMSGGGPDIYTLPAPEVIFTQTYTGQQVPQFFDLKLEAWEDDISADFDQLPAGTPFVFTNDCQTADGYSRCAYEQRLQGCFNLFGAGVMVESDDIYCNSDSFKINLDYRAAGPPGQWNSHGFIAGNCPTNNFYQPMIESYWRYTNNVTVPVSGRVISELATPVQSVTLAAVGSGSSQTALTAANGSYTLPIDSGFSYTVIPSKTNDISTSNGITSIDALLIRRHILGTPLSSPYKVIAADVNNSGGVTTGDYLLVRSIILQMDSSFPGNRLWAFVPHDFMFADPANPFPYDTSRSYTNATQLGGQNFIGMKLGDVNNSWDPNIRKSKPFAGKVILKIDSRESVISGEEVMIPVKARQFENVSGMQFTLSWDKDALGFQGVESGKLQADFAMQKTSAGLLGVLWTNEKAEGTSLGDEEILFSLKFVAIRPAQECKVNITSRLIPVEAVNANLELLELAQWKDGNSSDRYKVYQNYPNPFSEGTVFSFELPGQEQVTIGIYDMLGKEVQVSTEVYNDGRNDIQLGVKLTQGVYYLRFQTHSYSCSIKMVCLVTRNN